MESYRVLSRLYSNHYPLETIKIIRSFGFITTLLEATLVNTLAFLTLHRITYHIWCFRSGVNQLFQLEDPLGNRYLHDT